MASCRKGAERQLMTAGRSLVPAALPGGGAEAPATWEDGGISTLGRRAAPDPGGGMGITSQTMATVVPWDAVAFVFGGGRATRLPAARGARGSRRPGRRCAGFGAGTAPDEKKVAEFGEFHQEPRLYRVGPVVDY
jgi:hypothetical protein